MTRCKWTVRGGTNGTYWAYTPCKRGFNYLSKARMAEQVKSEYDGKLCPICGKVIECNTELIDGEE